MHACGEEPQEPLRGREAGGPGHPWAGDKRKVKPGCWQRVEALCSWHALLLQPRHFGEAGDPHST